MHVLATLPIGALPLVLNDLDLRGAAGGSVIASLAAGGASVVGGVLIIATFEGA